MYINEQLVLHITKTKYFRFQTKYTTVILGYVVVPVQIQIHIRTNNSNIVYSYE